MSGLHPAFRSSSVQLSAMFSAWPCLLLGQPPLVLFAGKFMPEFFFRQDFHAQLLGLIVLGTGGFPHHYKIRLGRNAGGGAPAELSHAALGFPSREFFELAG